MTGETGAGKTMVVTSLALLLGGRADPALVRIGAKNAVVEGRLVMDPAAPAAVRAEEAGAELEDGALRRWPVGPDEPSAASPRLLAAVEATRTQPSTSPG